jgi:hypothetical protein
MDRFIDRCIAEAHDDIRSWPQGGVFVVADNSSEADEMVSRFNSMTARTGLTAARRPSGTTTDANGRRIPTNEYDGVRTADDKPHNVSILVETRQHAEGYSLHRLGTTLMMPMASSPATRIQLRGRISRLVLQQRSELKYIVLYGKFTILEYLLERQASLDEKIESNNTLADLVIRFTREVEKRK